MFLKKIFFYSIECSFNVFFYTKYLVFFCYIVSNFFKFNINTKKHLTNKVTTSSLIILNFPYFSKIFLKNRYCCFTKTINYKFFFKKKGYYIKTLTLSFLFKKLSFKKIIKRIFYTNILFPSLQSSCIKESNTVNITMKIKKNFLKKFFFKEVILLRKHVIFRRKSFNYINSLLSNFLNFFLKKRVFLIFKKLNRPAIKLDLDNIIKFILLKIQRKVGRRKNFTFLNIFYKVLFFSFKLKDSNFFLKWYTHQVEITHFKRHKFMVYLLNIFLKDYHNHFFRNTKAKGVFFYISGKIGVAGNSKKRHIYMNFGKHSRSSKKIRLDISRSQVRTRTGVMGLRFNIFF